MKLLCYHIKQLVDKNRNDNNDNVALIANEEGAISGGYCK